MLRYWSERRVGCVDFVADTVTGRLEVEVDVVSIILNF